MRRAVLIAALLALAATGCGTTETSDSANEFKGEQAAVAEVVDRLAAAGKAGDAERICTDVLSKQLVTELKSAGGDCVSEMDRAIDDASDFNLTVRSVKVNGPNATAQVRQGDAGEIATFTFVKEGGGWRASALGTGS
jgi:hypothetical protein